MKYNALSPIFQIRFEAAKELYRLWSDSNMTLTEIARAFQVSDTTVTNRVKWYQKLTESESEYLDRSDHIFNLDTTCRNMKVLLKHNIHSIETIRNYSITTLMTIFSLPTLQAEWLRNAITRWEKSQKGKKS